MVHRATGVIVGALTLAFLFVFAVNVSLNTSLQTAQVATPPPAQSAWNFDEGSGTTVADSISTSHGTASSTLSWATGHSGSALEFAGANGSVYYGTNNFGLTSNKLTIALWVRLKSGENTGSFVPIVRRGQYV